MLVQKLKKNTLQEFRNTLRVGELRPSILQHC